MNQPLNPTTIIRNELNNSAVVLHTIEENPKRVDAIRAAFDLITRTLVRGGKLLACGNGGSAADASHLAAELVVRFRRNRVPYPCLALTTDPSVVTAAANDLGYEQVFARQVEAFGLPSDVLVAFTTSGTSANVLAALKRANARGLRTVVFTGDRPAPVAADHQILVPSTSTARIQEVHGVLIHALCEVLGG